VFFDRNDKKWEEEQEEYNSGAHTILTLSEVDPFLYSNHDQKKRSKAKRNIEKVIENLELIGLPNRLHVANGSKESEGNSSWKPTYEQNQSPCVVIVNSRVQLCDDCTTETHVAFENAQHNTTAFWEVLDTRDKGTGVGEGLRVSPYADVETHLPHLGFGYFLGDREPNHEVTKEV